MSGSVGEAERVAEGADRHDAEGSRGERDFRDESIVQLCRAAPGVREVVGHQPCKDIRTSNRVRDVELVAVIEHVDVAILVGGRPVCMRRVDDRRDAARWFSQTRSLLDP